MWFINDPGLLNRERETVQRLEEASPWLEGAHWHLDVSTGMLIIDADILASDKCYGVRVTYPTYYPSVPPSVRPRDAAHWSSHQYGGSGDLCLEHGPDNWQPNVHTAANMLESAYRLLSLEAENSVDTNIEIPSRHALTDGQKHRVEAFRWVVTPSTRNRLASVSDDMISRCKLYLMCHNQSFTAFVKEIQCVSGEKWTDTDIPELLKLTGQQIQGVIIPGQMGVLDSLKFSDPDSLTAYLNEQSIPVPEDGSYSANLEDIGFVISKGIDGMWQAYWRWSNGERVTTFSVVDANADSPAVRHGMDMDALRDTKVAIVGLGSAGSKIAASLARTGVGHFVLLDDDLLHPDNLVRHDSDWAEIGQHKVDAVAERIALINPHATVERRLHRLNGQESTTSAAAALSALGKADVIIDATANPNVFGLCAHIALNAKRTLIWLEIFAGGIGGLIARARPDRDPQPFTLRGAINDVANILTAEKGVEPPEAIMDYGMVDDDETIVQASDADVSVISAQVVQMTIDALLSREPSNYPHPAYFVGFARGWIFDQPFHTLPIECTSEVDWSTMVEADTESRDQANEFIQNLLKEYASDADTAPAG